jgi:hypothetical protein
MVKMKCPSRKLAGKEFHASRLLLKKMRTNATFDALGGFMRYGELDIDAAGGE